MPEHIRCVLANPNYMLELKDNLENQDYQWWVNKLDTSLMLKQVCFQDILKIYQVKIFQKDGN